MFVGVSRLDRPPAPRNTRLRSHAHPSRALDESGPHDVVLTYVTPRGLWYEQSWKGDVERSGGLATNIGIHMFDLLGWLFGPLLRSEVHLHHGARA